MPCVPLGSLRRRIAGGDSKRDGVAHCQECPGGADDRHLHSIAITVASSSRHPSGQDLALMLAA
jgi:hypothetical protein